MPFRGHESWRNGVDLAARTAEIERLALAGVYHFDIAQRLGVSLGTVESTMRLLRERGPLPSMRGPRAAVSKVDWKAAAVIWADLSVSTDEAADRIGCAERTIYRWLGMRGGRVVKEGPKAADPARTMGLPKPTLPVMRLAPVFSFPPTRLTDPLIAPRLPRWSATDETDVPIWSAGKQKERSCMTCSKKFLSEHAGNRMCAACR